MSSIVLQARLVAALRRAGREVAQELRERVLAGAEEDRVGVWRRFLRQGRDVQPAERDMRALSPVVIGNPICAECVRDVDLDHHQVRLILEIERLDVFVLQGDVQRGIEIRRQRREAERREQRGTDGSPVGAGGFGERGKDQFDASRLPEQVVHSGRIHKLL